MEGKHAHLMAENMARRRRIPNFQKINVKSTDLNESEHSIKLNQTGKLPKLNY